MWRKGRGDVREEFKGQTRVWWWSRPTGRLPERWDTDTSCYSERITTRGLTSVKRHRKKEEVQGLSIRFLPKCENDSQWQWGAQTKSTGLYVRPCLSIHRTGSAISFFFFFIKPIAAEPLSFWQKSDVTSRARLQLGKRPQGGAALPPAHPSPTAVTAGCSQSAAHVRPQLRPFVIKSHRNVFKTMGHLCCQISDFAQFQLLLTTRNQISMFARTFEYNFLLY